VLTSVAAIVLLLLGLSWGGREYPWDSPVVLGCLLGGALALVAFLWLESHAADPLLPLSLLRNGVVAISSTNSLAQSMVQTAVALFVPLYAQGVLGTSATFSGTIMLPLLASMLVSNLAAGMLIAHMGRYKAFAIVGFALSLVGFVALSRLDAAPPPLVLPLCLVVVGSGTGMIFPTLTLSYQSAVAFHELGVATALNQFSRAMGGTLGSALFGSLLIARFVPEVRGLLPPELGGFVDGPGGAGLRDPQSLLNPAAAEALRAAVSSTFPSPPQTAEVVLNAVRGGLAGALHWVFAAAAVVSLFGLLGSVVWREIPMRRSSARE
jgi:Major Facilitator Superfamily